MSRKRTWSVILGLLLNSILLFAAPARAELPAGPQVPTEARFTARLTKYAQALMFKEFEKSGVKDEKWNASMRQLLTDFWKHRNKIAGAPSAGDLERRARLLYLDGCDDGLLMLMHAHLAREMGQKIQSARSYRDAAAKLDKQGYSPLYSAAANAFQREILASSNPGQAKKAGEQMVQNTKDIFARHVYAKDERDILIADLAWMVQSAPVELKKAMWDAAKSAPDADPVAVCFLEGDYHVAAAWQSRGGGWAGTVTPDGWKGFEGELTAATQAFTAAWEADKTLPQIPAMMIQVSMGSGGPDAMRLWFDRAVAARFDYDQAYTSYIFGLYPRWHGDKAALMHLAEECRDTRRFDTVVPYYYVHILMTVRDECDGGDVADWATPRVYDGAHEIFEKSLTPGGIFARSSKFRSMEAAFCLHAGKWDDARKALDEVGGPLNALGTTPMFLSPANTRGQILVMTNGGAPALTQSAELHAAGKFADAASALDALLKNQVDPDATEFVRERATVSRWEADFQDGKTVKLIADAKLTGLQPDAGTWQGNADGSVTAVGDHHQHLNLVSLGQFGDSWEASVQIEFGRQQTDWNVTGITMAPTGQPSYASVTIVPKTARLAVRQNMGDAPKSLPIELKKDANILTLRRLGNKLTALVNGQKIYDGEAPPDDGTRRCRVGLGGWPFNTSDRVTFRNFTIRQYHEGL